jgi:hypothetical protein
MINKFKNFFKSKIIDSNDGQVLLIVVAALAITLGLTLGISSRVTSSLERTGTLDSFQKVTASAEGALEFQLMKTDSSLLSLVGGEVLSYTFPNGTLSEITVSKLSASDAGGMVYENLVPGDVISFNFVDFTTNNTSPKNQVCVDLIVEPANSPFMLNVVSENPDVTDFISFSTSLTEDAKSAVTSSKYLMEKYLYNGSAFIEVAPDSSSDSNYDYCFDKPLLLRLHPTNSEILKLTIKSNNEDVNNIPQGVKITSLGKFDVGDTTTRTIEAYKYLDTPANYFDYGVYLDNVIN